MIWADKTYDPETYNPNQSKHDPDSVVFNNDLFEWYQKFMTLRQNYKAIQLGDYTTIEKDEAKKLYVFSRKFNGEEVLVCINRSDKPISYTNQLLASKKFKDVFTKKMMKEVVIKPMDLVVLSN